MSERKNGNCDEEEQQGPQKSKPEEGLRGLLNKIMVDRNLSLPSVSSGQIKSSEQILVEALLDHVLLFHSLAVNPVLINEDNFQYHFFGMWMDLSYIISKVSFPPKHFCFFPSCMELADEEDGAGRKCANPAHTLLSNTEKATQLCIVTTLFEKLKEDGHPLNFEEIDKLNNQIASSSAEAVTQRINYKLSVCISAEEVGKTLKIKRSSVFVMSSSSATVCSKTGCWQQQPSGDNQGCSHLRKP